VGGLIERLTRNLVRRGIRDGLLGGNGVWLAAGALAWLVRFLLRREGGKVITENIRLGETITVTMVPAPPFGRTARKLARSERAEAKTQQRQVKAERARAHPPVAPPPPAPPALPLRD
jgi:hypothetical protein